jgi:hypothetical protein
MEAKKELGLEETSTAVVTAKKAKQTEKEVVQKICKSIVHSNAPTPSDSTPSNSTQPSP